MANTPKKMYLGENLTNYNQLVSKVNTMSDNIKTKADAYQNMKDRIKKLSDLNKKLADGYELSLRIVVDVSKLLENYVKMFDELEKMIEVLDTDVGIKQEDINYISNLTKESIIKITTDFNDKFPTIVSAFEKEGNKDSIATATKLKSIVNELPMDVADIVKNSKVGGKKNKHLK